MNRNPTHSDLQELLGAYAVDALDRDEDALVESHVARCTSCRQELESLREVLSHLSPKQPPAPSHVWDRIASSIERRSAGAELERGTPLRPRRRSISLRLASALAAAAVLIIGFMAIGLIQQDRRIAAIEAKTVQNGLREAASLAAADPRADRIRLTSPDSSLKGEVVLLPDGEGYLVRHNLPDPGPQSSYQLWALVNDRRISLGLVESRSRVTPFHAPPEVTGLAVTQEPAGGVPVSQKDPLVVGLRSA